jgi:hypothetical protein
MTFLLDIRNPLSEQYSVLPKHLSFESDLEWNDEIKGLWNSFTCLINYNPRLYRRDRFDTRIRKDKLNDSTSKQGWILIRITMKNKRTKLIPVNIRNIKKLSQLDNPYEQYTLNFTS